jgi:hypothetical protein
MQPKPLLAAILLSLCACGHPDNFNAEKQQAVTDSARQTLHRYYETVKQEGLLAEFAYLDSSAEFFWVPPGYKSPLNFDSVATILRSNATKWKLIDNKWDSLRVIPLSPELASYTGILQSSMTDTAGVELTFKMIETGVLIKRTDGWKLLHGQTSMLEF